MPYSKKKQKQSFVRRFQPMRIKSSQVGCGERSDQITAWLNYQAYTLFSRHKHVHMTKNYDVHNPTVATTNFAADILIYEKQCPDQTFAETYTSTEKQSRYEIFCKNLSTDKYHVSVSQKAIAMIKRVSENTQQLSRKTVIFLKIYEDDHYSALLYYPYNKHVEIFDASGSGFEIVTMRSLLYNLLQLLFGIRYDVKKHSKKLKVISKRGYQQSVFDEYCQTWVYFYLYKRFFCNYSVDDWTSFMQHYAHTPKKAIKGAPEKYTVGFNGLEMSNPYRKRLELITEFRDWFMHTSMRSVKKNESI